MLQNKKEMGQRMEESSRKKHLDSCHSKDLPERKKVENRDRAESSPTPKGLSIEGVAVHLLLLVH